MAAKAMKILAIDTALNACSVAITEGNETRAFNHEIRSRGHAETLLPLIRSLMSEAKLSFAELDLLAVTVGPGTFTGLRIGLAAARGIALAATKPCVGVTTLESLAASVDTETAEQQLIVPAIDARRQEVYLQSFQYGEEQHFPDAVSAPTASPIAKASEHLLNQPLLLLGNGAALLEQSGVLNGYHFKILDKEPNPDARLIAKIAASRANTVKVGVPPSPLYLRSPDAKLPGGLELSSKK